MSKDGDATQVAKTNDVLEHTLNYPYKLPTGEMLEKITLRRPKVRELKAASKRTNNTGELEIILASLICTPPITPEDFDEMDVRDYSVIQGFLR